MQYSFSDLSSASLFPSPRAKQAPTFRLLTESDIKLLQPYGVRAYFPSKTGGPIYEAQRRSLALPGPTVDDLFLDLFNYPIYTPDAQSFDDRAFLPYQTATVPTPPSPYSPGSSLASEPDIPQDPFTPSDDFDPEYFENLISMTNHDDDSAIIEELMNSQETMPYAMSQDASPASTVPYSPPVSLMPTPSPTDHKQSILTRVLTEGIGPKPQPGKSASKSGSKQRRRRLPREIDISPPQLGASGSASLWEFILELLADPLYEPYIRWRERSKGQFKIYDSQVVAALWGKHKNHAGMNFDKMSRAMRYYYGKNILEKGEEGGRLEYEFQDGSQWLNYISRNLNRRNFTAPSPNQYLGGQPMRTSRRRAQRGGNNPY
eukprot:m.13274 g.13274  ORF g.13274 m.13274 type:complete len:375 (+) comp24610_c0_seq3:62-1186(+)